MCLLSFIYSKAHSKTLLTCAYMYKEIYQFQVSFRIKRLGFGTSKLQGRGGGGCRAIIRAARIPSFAI